ncbi:MAG: aldo/keto reductase, partial [Sphingomonas sp.]
MKYRTLGDGLEVSALGLGCMPMADTGKIGYYGAADEGESLKTLHRAIELGVTFFDTAEVYGPYINEEWLGRAIAGKRDGLAIATKFGFRIGEGERMIGVDSSPANVRAACEGSLKRLGIDTIDLFYQHRVDPTVPIEETVGAMAE